MRWPIAALAAIFLTAHLAFLSPSLEDIDSINFALGVRDFDVGQHQPHPPGSPVFIAMAKGSTGITKALGIGGAESRGLAFWSAVGGALLLPLFALLFDALEGDPRRAFWTAVVAGLAPLAWFTAGRPMSDVPGLAAAVAAQVLILRTWLQKAPATSLILGAAIAGITAGIRVQTAALTVPTLIVALIAGPASVTVRARLAAVLAAAAGVLVWAVPLVIVSGGPANYMAALGSQAGEDLVGVVMLWTTPKLRVAFHAIVNAFVWPWGTLTLGAIVISVAAVGALLTVLKRVKDLVILMVLFGPYAIVHLLFQETLTMRYALPLIAPIAYLFVRGAESLRLSPFAEIAVVTAALITTVPQATAFAKGSPAFAAMTDAMRAGGAIAGHAGIRRVHEWLDITGEGQNSDGKTTFLRAPHGFEWLTLVEMWRKDPGQRIQFLANPRRTDYRALFDPYSRETTTPYRWPFVEWPQLGGARPGAVDRIAFSPPGWMLDRGWAVSAEVAGVTEVEGYGPNRRPSVGWVRARNVPATLMIGGRHLGDAGAPPVRLTASLNSSQVGEWILSPGYFFKAVEIPASLMQGNGYLPLSIVASAEQNQTVSPVKLEQFDLQAPGNVMVGAAEGWYEPEYNRTTGRAWRWMSERVVLWVRPVGRDVTLTIDGESPLRYFDASPTLRVSAAGRELARLSPADDFHWEITLPAASLVAAKGGVVIESDKSFVPAERDGAADKRRLAIRMYSFSVK